MGLQTRLRTHQGGCPGAQAKGQCEYLMSEDGSGGIAVHSVILSLSRGLGTQVRSPWQTRMKACLQAPLMQLWEPGPC